MDTTAIYDARPATLAEMSADLLGSQSSRALLSQLERLLTRMHALPARLYLHDAVSGVHYGAAAFGCSSTVADLLAGAPMAEGFFPVTDHGDPIGVLEVGADPRLDRPALAQLLALLGPVLVGMHQHERMVHELHEAHLYTAQLTSAGELLRHLDLEILLVRILETAMGAVQAQVGAVITAQEKALAVRATMGLRDDHVQALRLRSGRLLVEQAISDGSTICLTAGNIAEQLDLRSFQGNLTGLLVLPLSTAGRRHGAVLLANPERSFGPAQIRLAETVCSLAAIAVDNALLMQATVDRERLQRELDIARHVQESMYPPRGLVLGPLAVDGRSQPCNETGGDYFSFSEREGRLIAMIGDVSGHGLGAALYTTSAHAIIQQQWRARVGLEASFKILNDSLFHSQSGRFMTAAVVDIDPVSGTFSYTSAGHNPLLWVHGSSVRWLESTGMPLGILPDGDFPPPPPLHLDPGDYLILYTDGITEATDAADKPYGETRLADVVRQAVHSRLAPAAVLAAVLADVAAWTGGQPPKDDLTMVVIVCAGPV